MSERFDPKKELDQYRARRGEFRVLEVPTMHFRMSDGSEVIYRGDPRRAAPERLRTILRQPVGAR